MAFFDTDISGKLSQLRQLLDSGESDKAMAILQKDGCHTPELKNAFGVCLMRQGHIEQAANVLRDLVFGKLIAIPSDTPALFVANYATVLMLQKYNQTAMEIIGGLPASAHPYVVKLRWCIQRWRRQLPLHRRLLCIVGIYPAAAIPLTMPPGDL